MRAIEAKHLRKLVVVVKCGSFSAAAKELNVEVSSISRAVREIEEALGFPLFTRHARGTSLTAVGESYAASAREILTRYERAWVDARRVGNGHLPCLKIGFPWSAASTPLVELMRTFAGDFADVAVTVVEVGNDELMDRVRSGRLDIAIAITDPPQLPRLKDILELSTLPLWLESIAAVMPRSVELAAVEWSDLTQARLLCRTIDDWPRFILHIQRVGGPALVFEPHSVSQEGLLGLTAAGLGWTLLPISLGHLLPSEVHAIPISSPGATLQVEAVWHPDNDNPALTRFLTLCRQRYAPN